MSSAQDERLSDELEALEAILMNDVSIKLLEDGTRLIETVVHPSTGEAVDQQFVCATLEVKLGKGYPDVFPTVALRNPRGLDERVVAHINAQINKKLHSCVGHPVVFELIEVVRDNLTAKNLPSGQCVICLYNFKHGDVFIKTQCYHHFHGLCLANHLIASKANHEEELAKLPNWQKSSAPPYQQTCPVCRSVVSFDVEQLKKSPPPIDSVNDVPFRLTAELRALQQEMRTILARQIARGGVVGMGDNGPATISISSPSDNDEGTSTSSQDGAKTVEPNNNNNARAPAQKGKEKEITSGNSSSDNATPPSPQRPVYKGPYRGFNRRGKPGRRAR